MEGEEREAQLQGVDQQEQGGTDLVCSGTEGNVLPGSQAARQGMGRNAKVDYGSAFVPSFCICGCSCCCAAVTATVPAPATATVMVPSPQGMQEQRYGSTCVYIAW